MCSREGYNTLQPRIKALITQKSYRKKREALLNNITFKIDRIRIT